MSCGVETMYLSWMTVVATSTTVVFIPGTDWVDAGAIVQGKGWGEARGRNGQATATPAVQFTNDPRNASGAGTAVGSPLSADGVSDPTGSVALSSGAYKYARGGWNVALASGSTLATVTVSGVIQLTRGS